MQTLIDRLKTRKTETPESLQRRINKVEKEMPFADRCDHILINDVLDRTLKEAESIVHSYIEKS